ncbi:MAG TPA: hypothetical protein VGR09_08005 [Gemmatimonadales bacterium]|nr:hypothetical protein [Gemmatimonadales bacterium]
MLRWLLTGCALSTLLVDSARAQAQVITWPLLSQLSSSSLYIGRPADPLDPHLLAAAPSDTVAREIKPTHWKEDGIVGAVLIGGSSAWLGHAICRNSQGGSCTGALVGGALGGGLIGFLIGALIGGQFPKQPTSAPAETT